MASTFFSSGKDAIQRTIDINPDDIADILIPETPEDFLLFEKIYDVKWTAEEIIVGKYNQIALQFPDELLCVSVPIFQCLKKRLPSETSLYVSSGHFIREVGVYVRAYVMDIFHISSCSCCVDEVTAQHVNADLIVHYGYSCLSTPSRLPVLFVFPKAQIDIKTTVDSLLDTLLQQDVPSHVILIPDVSYAHVSDTLYNELQSSHRLPPNVTVIFNLIPRRASPVRQNDTLSVPNNSTTQSQLPSHRRYTLPDNVPLSSCIILYVGKESLGLTNLMTHPNNTIISYNPSSRIGSSDSAKIESVRSNKLLMRRYAIVQKARDADIFGILVGTLGVASYLPLISHLRDLIRRRKKKFYTLTVGKLSPAKLANFADIECFVMVACENSVVESNEFYRPIITPFELYLALSGEPIWPGNCILDFEQLTPTSELGEQNTADDGEKDPDRPMFSLATGKYRYVKRYEMDHFKESESTAGQVGFSSESSSDLIYGTPILLWLISLVMWELRADFLRQKTFKGLETRLGQDAPSVLKQGRSGIAKDYNEQL
ncbi:hypothetical protein Clacol_010521 [Clathrus columnatus]|uniref:2-(3-amino-3-carboxypropyl)histidine synthase subunit 2 n=1 Tax=Clathrus columnatus TaxID=1419009 RepID=A0AAV5AWD9_9AGAM|nr:hypothetical protein Clacol_010521 [Clathrus columnatus]